jgi:hypothetical protein
MRATRVFPQVDRAIAKDLRATFGAEAVDQRFASSMCISPPPLPPLSPIERRVFDYSEIGRSMAQLDLSIRQTKRVLDRLAPAPDCR